VQRIIITAIGQATAPTTYCYAYTSNCTWGACVTPVSGATAYRWSYITTPCCGTSTAINGQKTTDLCVTPVYPFDVPNIEVQSYSSGCFSAPATFSCGSFIPSNWEDVCYGFRRKEFRDSSSSIINSINVYPNPNNGIVSIKNNSNYTIYFEVFTLTGIKVSKLTLKEGETKQISNLPDGLLLGVCSDEQNNIIQRKKISVIRNE